MVRISKTIRVKASRISRGTFTSKRVGDPRQRVRISLDIFPRTGGALKSVELRNADEIKEDSTCLPWSTYPRPSILNLPICDTSALHH